jgi:hypothetical protein
MTTLAWQSASWLFVHKGTRRHSFATVFVAPLTQATRP